MTRKDPMRILEAGYRLGLDEEQWARGIVEARRGWSRWMS